MTDGPILSGKTRRRLETALRKSESQPTGPRVHPPTAIHRQLNWQGVEITADPDSEGYYGGTVELYSEDKTSRSDGDVFVFDANGASLDVGKVYDCVQVGHRVVNEGTPEEDHVPVFASIETC